MDEIIRAMSKDGFVKAVAVVSTDLVERAREQKLDQKKQQKIPATEIELLRFHRKSAVQSSCYDLLQKDRKPDGKQHPKKQKIKF